MVLEVIRALARRWYIILVGLLLTAGLVYGAYVSNPPEYQARGLVLLLPSEAAVGKGGNPFLLLSGLEQPAGIVVAYFSSATAQAEVKAVSPTAAYQVAIDDSTRGPVISVDVTADSAQETLVTLNHIVAQIPVELTSLQRQVDAPTNAVIGSMALTVDKKAAVARAGTLRALIAALVVGLVGTGVAGVSFDSLAQRRRMRDPQRHTPGSAGRRNRGNTRRHGASSRGEHATTDGTNDDGVAEEKPEPSKVGHVT